MATQSQRRKYVVTNRHKLDAFMRDGGKINDLSLLVGQVTGTPKYSKGHVGSKSRDRTRKSNRLGWDE